MSAIRSGIVIAGKYQLESPLAQGGMGSVWIARHVLLDARVAIKFIAHEVAGTESSRRRFEREAKAAAMLQSPHVVRIYDYGVEGGAPYLVMELLDGQDLAARLAERGRLSVLETVDIVTQIARALRRASEAAIVHRDLKPSNVFIVPGDDEDTEEVIKVLDFGVAKAPRLGLAGEVTQRGIVVGSPRYMSPEQARSSGTVDPRSDLWSLAVIAYRALTGRMPFHANEVADLIVRICTEAPLPPSQIVPELGPDLDAFFARAFDRDPNRRFQTARELALAFAAAAGEPAPASTGSRPSLQLPPFDLRLAAEAVPTSAEPFVGRRRPPASDGSLSPLPAGLDVSPRTPRAPWHVRLRQGIVGAALAAFVVGSAMSFVLWQRETHREPASAAAGALPAVEAELHEMPPAPPIPSVSATSSATTAASAGPPTIDDRPPTARRRSATAL